MLKLLRLAPLMLVLAVGSTAEELRIETLIPAGDGSWTIELAGGSPAELTFEAGGGAVRFATRDGRGYLDGVAADAERLALRDGDDAELALRLAPSPSPWAGASVYHVMMGFFRNGTRSNDGEIDGWRHKSYAGGDLQGVLEKADYLAELGVDAVWLSPIFKSETSHGYDVRNYYRIGDAVAVPEDAEASLALYRQVRDALHERGIRLILDVPLNHASKAYERKEGDPKQLKPRATRARQEAEKVWEGWNAGFKYWNFDNEKTRRFLKDVALYWLVEEKADGLRLDYVRGVPHDFWAELYAEVKAAKPDAWLLGECWIDGDGAAGNAEEIARYYAPVEGRRQFDSLLDFPLQIVATDVFARGAEPALLERWLQYQDALYGPGTLPAHFLDNHDMARFLAWTDEDDRLAAAVTYLATLSRPLILFYGTETGLSGGVAKAGFTDASRVPMPWDSLDEELINRFRKALELRRRHPSLHAGIRLPLATAEGVLVFAKRHADEVALVAVNNTEEPREVRFDAGSLAGEITAAIGEEPACQDGRCTWQLGPSSTSVAFSAPK